MVVTGRQGNGGHKPFYVLNHIWYPSNLRAERIERKRIERFYTNFYITYSYKNFIISNIFTLNIN
jgi:hypothetical protein